MHTTDHSGTIILHKNLMILVDQFKIFKGNTHKSILHLGNYANRWACHDMNLKLYVALCWGSSWFESQPEYQLSFLFFHISMWCRWDNLWKYNIFLAWDFCWTTWSRSQVPNINIYVKEPEVSCSISCIGFMKTEKLYVTCKKSDLYVSDDHGCNTQVFS